MTDAHQVELENEEIHTDAQVVVVSQVTTTVILAAVSQVTVAILEIVIEEVIAMMDTIQTRNL